MKLQTAIQYLAVGSLLVVLQTWAQELPKIPLPSEISAYEREKPVFNTKSLGRERGDALFTLLDGGRSCERWMQNGLPPGIVCALPAPPSYWFTANRKDGTNYSVGLTQDGGLLHLREGLYVVPKAKQEAIQKVLRDLGADLKREVLSAPKPLTYTVGTLNDGGTLSGISRLFYGDASQWKRIQEANRKTLNNPNVIDDRMKLVIPELLNAKTPKL